MKEDFLQICKTFLENNFVQALVALLIFLVIIKVANIVISSFIDKIIKKTKGVENKKQIATFKTVVISIADTVLCVLGLLQILNILGVDIRPLLATAGVVGVAISFGAKTVVEDIITGILILISNQIRVGDDIEIADSRGIVEQINLRVVVLRDSKNVVYYIRNSLITKVTNYTR